MSAPAHTSKPKIYALDQTAPSDAAMLLVCGK